jgi:hypothetical protein
MVVEPVDPLVKENDKNNDYFNADEEMLYILMNKDINEYLNFVNNKYSKIEKLKIKKEEEDKEKEIKNLKYELLIVQTQLNNINTKLEYEEKRNKYKNQMIQNINEGFDKLERTLKNFKNI